MITASEKGEKSGTDPFTKGEEKNSLANLRGIPNEINPDVHLSRINKHWNEFYRKHPPATTTKQEILDFAKKIDDLYGHLFNPLIRQAPGATPGVNPLE